MLMLCNGEYFADQADYFEIIGHWMLLQVCWKKFCVYFEVEMRAVPVKEDYLVLDPKDVPEYVDENTIGVVSIFGSTYNGQFEDVEALDSVVGAPFFAVLHTFSVSLIFITDHHKEGSHVGH